MSNTLEQREPDKWHPTPEEQADGNRGIRWVWSGVIHGRPTSHDLRDYLLRRGDSAMCSCQDCQTFYTSPPTSADAVDAERLTTVILEAMEWGRDHWARFSMSGHDQREIAEQFADKARAAIAATKEKA